MLVAAGTLLSSCGPNAAPARQPMRPPLPASTPTATTANSIGVLYAGASADASSPGGFAALALPSGQRLGTFSDLRRQGGGFAIAPSGERGYLLDGPYFHELELPSLKPIRSIQIDDALAMLGTGRVVAVSPDGSEVYVETTRIVGSQKWDPQLATGQPDSVYGIAVYDVAHGVVTRRFDLAGPWCGVAELFAVPDGRLAIFCGIAQNVRLIDPADGHEIARIGLGDPPRAGNSPGRAIATVASPDGKVLYVARDSGGLVEVDLVHNVLARGVVVGGDGGQRVPYQRLHLSQDGTRLLVRAAVHQIKLRSGGIGDVVWVIDTGSLQRIAEVQLPAPASDAAPTPDGRMLITSNTNTQSPDEKLPRLVEIPSGRELARWQGSLASMQIAPVPTESGQVCTGTVVGRIAWGYDDHRPVADDPVRVTDSPVSARTDAEGQFSPRTRAARQSRRYAQPDDLPAHPCSTNRTCVLARVTRCPGALAGDRGEEQTMRAVIDAVALSQTARRIWDEGRGNPAGWVLVWPGARLTRSATAMRTAQVRPPRHPPPRGHCAAVVQTGVG